MTRETRPFASPNGSWNCSTYVFSEPCPVIEQHSVMRVQFVPEKAELDLRSPKNLILIENNEDSVVIHAARDNLSERGKACFIRYLAAEGFISNEFERFGKSGSRPTTSITWVVEQERAQRQLTHL